MYLAYSVYCLNTFFTSACDAGFLHSYFPFPKILYINNNITSVFFFLVIGSHIFLTLVLLKIDKRESFWLYITGNILSIAFVILGLLLLFPFVDGVFRNLIIKTSYIIVFIMDVYIASALIYCIQKKQTFVYFYFVGFVFSLIGTTILILANIGIIDDINQNYG